MEGAVVLQLPGEFLFFPDARMAEGWMEPVDVTNSEYRAFGDDGRPLRIEILEQEHTAFKVLRWKTEYLEVREGSGVALDTDELRDFFGRIGVRAPADSTLDDLISLGLERNLHP